MRRLKPSAFLNEEDFDKRKVFYRGGKEGVWPFQLMLVSVLCFFWTLFLWGSSSQQPKAWFNRSKCSAHVGHRRLCLGFRVVICFILTSCIIDWDFGTTCWIVKVTFRLTIRLLSSLTLRLTFQPVHIFPAVSAHSSSMKALSLQLIFELLLPLTWQHLNWLLSSLTLQLSVQLLSAITCQLTFQLLLFFTTQLTIQLLPSVNDSSVVFISYSLAIQLLLFFTLQLAFQLLTNLTLKWQFNCFQALHFKSNNFHRSFTLFFCFCF